MRATVRITAVDAGWRVLVGDGATRPVEGLVPRGPWLDGLTAALPAPRVLVAGSDAAVTRAEDARAAQFADALARSGAAWAHLQVLKGRAEGAGATLTVVIDADDAEVRGLPWELLSLGDGPHEVAGGFVVRWVAGPPRASNASPTVCVWVGAPDDVSAALSAEVEAAATDAGLRCVGVADRPTVVWLLAHGTRAADQLEVALAGAPSGSTAALSARLHEALGACALAVAGVCHAGAAELAPREGLADRLHQAGVPVVVAPPRAVPTELLARFARASTAAIGRGASLGEAVAAGRRAVRGWAMPHPLARWTAVPCSVSVLSALDLRPCPAARVPDGWPAPDPAAAAWLEAAWADAERRADGSLGVEHLLRVLGAVAAGGPLVSAIRRIAPGLLAASDAASAVLRPQRDTPCTPTPRLVAFGAALPARFGVEDLAELVLDAFPVGAVALGAETAEASGLPGAGQPATALEVLGGPEDGRRLALREGDVVGRAGGDATHPLYAETRLTDPTLSRRHLRWAGGALTGERPIEVDGPEGPRDPHAPLRVGDVVRVTAGTRLRGIR